MYALTSAASGRPSAGASVTRLSSACCRAGEGGVSNIEVRRSEERASGEKQGAPESSASRPCARPGCPNVVRWTGRGRPPKYCSVQCRRRIRQRADLGRPQVPAPLPTPFSQELQRAIVKSGKSLAWISAQLAATDILVSPPSLSAWQRGRYQPAPDERVHALERVLGLRAGWLALRLAASPPAQRQLPDTGKQTRGLQAELVTHATQTLPSDYMIIAVCDEVHVGADHRMTHLVVRQTVRALRDGVDSAWSFYSPDARRADVRVGAEANCRIGRRVRLEDGRLAVELLFDRRLARGEKHTYRFQVEHRYADATELSHRRTVATHTVETLGIRVIFAERPRAVWLCQWSLPDDTYSQDTATIDEATVTLTRISPVPATYGVRWSY
jgi:hypothetical protein